MRNSMIALRGPKMDSRFGGGRVTWFRAGGSHNTRYSASMVSGVRFLTMLYTIPMRFQTGAEMSRPFALSIAAALCLSADALGQNRDVFPEGPGKQIVEERCGICHVVRHARSSDYSAEGWRTTLAQMRNIGLPLSDEEFETVAIYLTTINPERPR